MEFSGQNAISTGRSYGNQTASNYTVATDEQLESPSRIRDGVGNTEQVLSAIQESISMLERRLDAVLRPVPPSTAAVGAANSPQGACSHLTGRLEILNDGFLNVNHRLRELMARIEV